MAKKSLFLCLWACAVERCKAVETLLFYCTRLQGRLAVEYSRTVEIVYYTRLQGRLAGEMSTVFLSHFTTALSAPCNITITAHSLYSVQCTVYSVQCTVYNVEITVYSVQCTLYSVRYSLWHVHCTVCSVQCMPSIYLHCTALHCTALHFSVWLIRAV